MVTHAFGRIKQLKTPMFHEFYADTLQAIIYIKTRDYSS